ncbi:MAG: RluA family pseudouridine synthase [Gracilibacteraceae bacterium]|jgi:23S rRNA pseudouridine1911/1915/1917 synthase|nr:RluA family pseudouridine synthase [Gracilibacteraceae bacterium]
MMKDGEFAAAPRRESWREVSLEAGERLDAALAERTGLSRAFVQKMIQADRVRVNGRERKANYRLRPGDQASMCPPPPPVSVLTPENIPLDVIYEDGDLLVVNKPRGMVVHPAPGAWTGTLVHALLYRGRELSALNGPVRPGIVHRIDKDTSGLLVVAKNDAAHHGLASQIQAHSMRRLYRAVVWGLAPGPAGTIDAPISRSLHDRKKMSVQPGRGRAAITHYRVLRYFPRRSEQKPACAEISARLETGRTHQIRVHMDYIGHPVLGDPLYGGRRHFMAERGQMLHAETLGFRHPRTGAELEFHAPPPPDFAALLDFFSVKTSIAPEKTLKKAAADGKIMRGCLRS